MTENIINGITEKLHELYPDYPVHVREVSQNLQEPAFIVKIIQPTLTDSPGGTYARRDLVEIVFFPGDSSDYISLYPMFEEIAKALRCVTDPDTGDRFRADGLTGNVSDGVLVITGTFVYWEREIEEAEYMRTLEVNEDVNS